MEIRYFQFKEPVRFWPKLFLRTLYGTSSLWSAGWSKRKGEILVTDKYKKKKKKSFFFFHFVYVCVWYLCMQACSVSQLCPLICKPMDCSHQAPLSMEFFRQEYWSGLPFSTQGELPNPGTEPVSCIGRQILYHWAMWEAWCV